jgi:formate hydrogenlyase subunit 3/multisubunit Na+/H+ antiporter MnhD subunit
MTAALLTASLAWPLVLLGAWCLAALRPVVYRLAATLALPALLLSIVGDTAVRLAVPGVFTGLLLGLDGTGRPFLLLTAALWSVAGLYAVTYMRDDPRRDAFTAFMLATGLGNIGLTIALDGLGFYLFFTVMTFAAYGLVAHSGTAAAQRAGRIYVVMAVAGEALLLAALLRLAADVPGMEFGEATRALGGAADVAVVSGLLLAGFGVKAGLIPLHVWLPLAHPVAPTPASALLSGALIKAGVLGWLRYLPLGLAALPQLGAAVVAMGTVAAFAGAVMGVVQRDPKTVLAYSSVSQMGFMAVGVGAALMVPAAAAGLAAAVAVYAVHHAFAKASLFLALGAAPTRAPGRRRWPWLVACVLPGIALAGAPLTSGALAKAALKQSLGELPSPWDVRIDALLAFAAVGTTLLVARYLATFAGSAAGRPSVVKAGTAAPWLTAVALSTAAAAWLPAVTGPEVDVPLYSGRGLAAAALWPIALGVVIAAAARVLGRRRPALSRNWIPPGDIVLVAERAVQRIGDLAKRTEAPHAARAIAERLAPLPGVMRRWLDAVAVFDERVSAAPAVGAFLAAVAAALFLALSA